MTIPSDNFLDLLKDTSEKISPSSKEALQWYKDSISGLYKRDQNKFFKKTSLPEMGSMYLFAYDPKYKETLPFYDLYPLVIPIEYSTNSFLGLNLHYLPPLARSAILDRMMVISNNNKYDEKTKVSVSYNMMQKYATNTNFKICVKRYLYGHVRSSFYQINPVDWKKIVVMPLQMWKVNDNKKYAGSPPY
jgi:hypothetical protein